MAFENNNFKVVKKIRLPKSEFNVSCKISADGEISKIFALSFNAYPVSQEITNGTVSFTGYLDVCMIYQLETGEIGSAFASCPISSRFEDPLITNGEKAIITLKEIDHTVDSVAGAEAVIGVTLEQEGVLIEGVDVHSITTNDENICVKEDELSVVKFVGSGSANVSETATYPTREKIKKVLGTQSDVIVKETAAGTNFVSASGDVVTNILYIDESDRFCSAQVFSPFKEEIEIEGATENSHVEATSQINVQNIKVSVEEDEKGGKISVVVPFELTAYAYEESALNMVVGLYSTQSEMEISTETFDMAKNLSMQCVEGKVDGSLVLELDQPRVDKILFTFGSSAQVTNSYISAAELVVEGIAKTTVVYLNDEASSLNAVEIEVPFQISDKTNASEDALILVTAILTDVDVAVKKGRELFFDGKVRATALLSESEVNAVISQAKEGEQFEARDYAMQLVFAKQGDELWDIAKMNRVKQTVIAEQNPTAVFPLQENREIIIFYQNK